MTRRHLGTWVRTCVPLQETLVQGGPWEAEKFRSCPYGVSLPAICPCHFRSGAALQSGLEPIPRKNAGVEDSCAPFPSSAEPTDQAPNPHAHPCSRTTPPPSRRCGRATTKLPGVGLETIRRKMRPDKRVKKKVQKRSKNDPKNHPKKIKKDQKRSKKDQKRIKKGQKGQKRSKKIKK